MNNDDSKTIRLEGLWAWAVMFVIVTIIYSVFWFAVGFVAGLKSSAKSFYIESYYADGLDPFRAGANSTIELPKEQEQSQTQTKTRKKR